ncbi:hypothetical protein ACFU44_00430 [Nocardia rhizosphaerihabitans]|uniref:hypothetical protein n=1 Tax=Nocardia rhizosphaerihabitans TaxID=1691570 RepID=UPI00366CC891
MSISAIDLDYRCRYTNAQGAETAVVEGEWRYQTGPDSWSDPQGLYALLSAGPYTWVGPAPKPYVNPNA